MNIHIIRTQDGTLFAFVPIEKNESEVEYFGKSSTVFMFKWREDLDRWAGHGLVNKDATSGTYPGAPTAEVQAWLDLALRRFQTEELIEENLRAVS